MTDGFETGPPDDPPDGGSDADGDEGASRESGGTGSDGGGTGHGGARTDPNGDGIDANEGGTGPGDEEDDADPSLAGVFGARPEDEPPRTELVPESPSLENAFFLLLGVLLGGFVVYRAVTVFTA
jgi:hypothetical protein